MTLKVDTWKNIPEERLNDFISRQIITGENVMLATLRLKKGAVIPEHQHEAEQISYVVSGALKFRINGEDLMVRTGQVLVIPTNVPHAVWAEEDTVDIDSFSPIRHDWLDGSDHYIRGTKK